LGGAINNPATSTPFRLGRQYGPSYVEYWPGRIDEVRVWSAAVDQATIQNWMWQGVTSSHPYYANLASYWPLNDGSGTNVADLSGVGNTGMIVSNVAWVPGQSLSNEVVGYQVSGLIPNTTYYYQMVATNTAGETFGPTIQFRSGLFGYVTSPCAPSSLGVQNALVTGTAGFSAYTDTNGYFHGSGVAQTLSVTKHNVYFSPASQQATGNAAANFTVVQGTIQGHISGMASGTSNVTVSYGFYEWPVFLIYDGQTQSDMNGNYTFPGGDTETYEDVIVTPSKAGYYFIPYQAQVSAGVDANFVVGSTPPSFSGPPGNLTVYEGALAITNTFELQMGTMPASGVTVSVSGSSNVALVPFTPGNIQLVTTATNLVNGTNFIEGIVIVYVTPGAVGQTTISVAVNDTINPPVTASFTLAVQKTNQIPVAGMPVALSFNDTTNLVRVANFANLAPTTEVTVEFWENVQAVKQQAALILGQDNSQDRFAISGPWPIGTYGTVFWDFGDINGSGRLSYALPNSVANQWTHFAFVSSQTANNGAGLMAIYINGTLVQSKTGGGSFANYSDDLLIGSPGFRGALSDLRIWNVALSASNILATMNNPLVGNEPGLMLYYRFNEDSGLTIHDSSTNALNGAIQGDAPYAAWAAAPTNFEYYVIPSYSSNNVMYLPGYLQDDSTPSQLVWTLANSNNLEGTLSQVAGGQWLYTPAPDYPGGNVNFTYAVSAGSPGPGVLSNTMEVYIKVASLFPPVLSPIRSQLTEANSSTAPILFTVTDTNTPVNQLTVTAAADNPALVASFPSGFSLTMVSNNSWSNATYSLVITPIAGAIGFTSVTLEANDGHNVVTESFVLQVNQKPAYTIIDLGVLPGRYASYGRGINNQGQVVGYCTEGDVNQTGEQGFYYTGFAASQQIIALATNSGLPNAAYAINDNGLVTGVSQFADGYSQAFLYNIYSVPPALLDSGALGTNSTGSASTGFGINDNGIIVGGSTTQTNGQLDAFVSGASLADLGLPGLSVATGINNARQMAGYIVGSVALFVGDY